jgi:hypothetical protein
MASSKIARRRVVAGTGVASAAFVAAPFVLGAYAAGKLTLALRSLGAQRQRFNQGFNRRVGGQGKGRGQLAAHKIGK